MFFKLNKHNPDIFFKRKFSKNDICIYDSTHFSWNDVVDLANANNITIQHISRAIDPTVNHLTEGKSFYVTGRLVPNPDIIKRKKETPMMFDPELLDI